MSTPPVMGEQAKPQPSRAGRPHLRRVGYLVVMLAALLAAGFAGIAWYASTPQFSARVRHALVTTLQNATGGHVEIAAFRWSLRHFAIEVDGLTIHGREAPDQVPYFHVDHLSLRARLISFFAPRISLASVEATRPTFHLIVYPDGSTNQPQPHASGGKPLPQVLLDLEIGSTRVQNGLILLNNRKVPWEFASGPLQVAVRYARRGPGYKATIDARDLTFRLKKAAEARSRMKAAVELTRDSFSLDRLDLATGSSRLSASGQLRNFNHPAWSLVVSGSVDAKQVGAITGVDELRNGQARLAIDASGKPDADGEAFQVKGHVDVHSGQWDASWLRLRNVDLSTNLIVDNDQCSLTDLSSVLEDGGRISGSLIMRHCVGPSAPATPAVVQQGSGIVLQPQPKESVARRLRRSSRHLLERLHGKQAEPALAVNRAVYRPLEADMEAQVSGVTLPLIMAAVAPRQYWNIGFTTATSGKVTARWTGNGRGLDVHGDLTMRAPRRLLGLIPVTGSAHADYLGDHNRLLIQNADENTPATTVHAAGLLTLDTHDLKSALHLDTTGTNLGEFDQLLRILDLWETPAGQPHALPLQLYGPATFHGVIGGSFFALQAAGHMDARRFDVIVARAAKPGAPAPAVHRLRWDAFHSVFAYTPARLTVHSAELVRGAATIHTSLDLSPEKTGRDAYTYSRRTRIVGMVQTHRAPISDLQAVAGYSSPASGDLDADAHVSGAVDDLDGSGDAELTHGLIAGQPIAGASIHVAARGHQLQLTKVRFSSAGGKADGHFIYDDQSGAISGELTGERFGLDQVRVLDSARLPLGGIGGFHLKAAGTTESPIADAALQIEDMTLNHQPMGHVQAEAHLQQGRLLATARADLLKTHVAAAGSLKLTGDYPAQAELTFTGFNFEPLLRLTSLSGVEGASSLDGTVTLSGPLKQLASIEADAKIKAFSATINRHPLHSAGPLEISLRKGVVRLSPARIEGRDVDLTATGTVDLLQQYRMRLHSEGSIDAGMIAVLYPSTQSSGQVRFTVDARGTTAQPDLRGRAEVRHVNLHALNVTNGLTDMNGELLFDQDRLVIQNLKGSSGGGLLDLHGFVGYRRGIFVDLTANTTDVRVRYPAGVSSSVDAKLRLQGTSESSLLSGSLRLVRFGIGSNLDLASFATSGSGVSAPTDPTSPLNRVRLDVHVTSAPELGFQNSFASLAGEVNLRIRGTLENPSVLGRVDISQGSASFAGTNYKLQQGDIVFSNPVTISPVIDLEAQARVQNYDIVISLHGPPSKLDISYRSEPPLTQADVLALLALGRTNEQALMYGEQQQANANLTSEALLGGALNAAVSSRVQKLFGVGSVRVDPNFVGTLGESTARVTVEEQVGPQLTLTFATSVNTTAQQLLQAQYDLTRTVSVIAVRDEADVFSMYLQIRGRHR